MAKHSPKQQAKIRALMRDICQETGMKVEDYASFLKDKFCVDSFADMTMEQATKILYEMETHKIFLSQ